MILLLGPENKEFTTFSDLYFSDFRAYETIWQIMYSRTF